MPYVNCPKCTVRGFVLAPWSAVARCPTCDAPLAVPRQSMARDLTQRTHQAQPVSLDARREAAEEAA